MNAVSDRLLPAVIEYDQRIAKWLDSDEEHEPSFRPRPDEREQREPDETGRDIPIRFDGQVCSLICIAHWNTVSFCRRSRSKEEADSDSGDREIQDHGKDSRE